MKLGIEKALECLGKIKSKHIFKDISLNLFINYLDACLKLKSYARIKNYYDRESPSRKKMLRLHLINPKGSSRVRQEAVDFRK